MRKRLLTGISILLSISLTVQANEIHHLRGLRYCEIFLGNQFSHDTKVYNTIGLNQCPENIWNKISTEKIKQETGAAFVHLNGPRYWMIDGIQNYSLENYATRIFDGLAMREVGVLQLNLKDIIKAKTPYQKHIVHRQTTWIYESGKPIYEIKNAQGETFVMQSFSIQKISQTQESLATLGTKLHLPKGWTFQSRILDKNIYLIAKNKLAVVIQDEFLNTYQQENS